MKVPLNESNAPTVFRPYGPPKLLTERANTDGTPIWQVTGVFQNYLDINSNGRVYPRHIWERVLNENSEFMQKVKRRGVLGVLEHPDDGRTRIFEASHVITNAWIASPQEIAMSKGQLREGDILGSYEILGTRSGQDLQALHEARCEVGVSSRGAGSVIVKPDREEVCEDYDVDTWDIVAVPSVTRATPTPVRESVTPPTPPTSTPSATPAETIPAVPLQEGSMDRNHKPHTTMSKQAEFRKLRNHVTGLMETKVKGLRPTQLATLIESLSEAQAQASTLASEDPTLTVLAFSLSESVQKRLTEMDEEFDEAPPEAPPAADNATDGIDPVADAAIERAVEFLSNSEDPEAQEIADDLRDVTIAHDPGLEGDLTDAEVQSLPESVGRKVIALSKRHRLLHVAHNRLESCAGQLLERSKANSSKLGLVESANLKVKKLTTQLTETTKNLMELAHEYTKIKLPDLYEANKAALTEAKDLEAFEAIVETALKAAPAAKPATPAAAKPSKLSEERRAALRKRLQERKNVKPAAAPAPAAAAAPTPPKQSLTEDAHEAVSMTRRLSARR